MLSIPFYSFGSFILLFAVVGAVILTFSIHQLIKGDKEEPMDWLRIVLGILGGIIFLLCGSIFSIGNIWSTYNFRNIDISQVKSLRVIKSEDENKNDNSNFVYFENTDSIQKGLKNLNNCIALYRNHESFQDGYKLQIIFFDENIEKDFYISVYRKNNFEEEKGVVIPHYYEDKNINLGDFSCPDFQDWVTTNIDPLFLKKSQ